MTRLMFVDDDLLVLEALRRGMRSMQAEWSMRFANSASDALQQLATEAADVVVSDMRMPGMDGSEFLAEIKRLYPQSARFILSGHPGIQPIECETHHAHCYLSKPCDAVTLKAAIERHKALNTPS